MASRHIARALLAGSLASTLSLALAAAGPSAQDVARGPLTIGSGRVSIAGTSNVHEYSASTTVVRVTRLQLADRAGDRPLWDQVLEPGTLEHFDIAIPTTSLSSPKEGIDKNMHKALKAQEHQEITFRLLRIVPGNGAPGTLSAVGMLQIAGVEREVTLALKTARAGSDLSIKGELALLMTDYGIVPPKAMLGMLKTDPKVTVTFEVVLAASQT
jgi:polyisoprenoid-binding protein YceI